MVGTDEACTDARQQQIDAAIALGKNLAALKDACETWYRGDSAILDVIHDELLVTAQSNETEDCFLAELLDQEHGKLSIALNLIREISTQFAELIEFAVRQDIILQGLLPGRDYVQRSSLFMDIDAILSDLLSDRLDKLQQAMSWFDPEILESLQLKDDELHACQLAHMKLSAAYEHLNNTYTRTMITARWRSPGNHFWSREASTPIAHPPTSRQHASDTSHQRKIIPPNTGESSTDERSSVDDSSDDTLYRHYDVPKIVKALVKGYEEFLREFGVDPHHESIKVLSGGFIDELQKAKKELRAKKPVNVPLLTSKGDRRKFEALTSGVNEDLDTLVLRLQQVAVECIEFSEHACRFEGTSGGDLKWAASKLRRRLKQLGHKPSSVSGCIETLTVLINRLKPVSKIDYIRASVDVSRHPVSRLAKTITELRSQLAAAHEPREKLPRWEKGEDGIP